MVLSCLILRTTKKLTFKNEIMFVDHTSKNIVRVKEAGFNAILVFKVKEEE